MTWYDGLPVVASRELIATELTELKEQRSDMIRSSSLFALTGALVAALVIIILNMSFGWTWIVVFGAMRATSALIGNQRWVSPRRLFRLRRDIDERMVYVCEGHSGDALIDSRFEERLTLEVLPLSSLIWRLNGTPLNAPRFAPVSRTTTPPPHAAYAANFVQPVDDHDHVFLHRRPLSAEEIAELDRYAPRVQLVNAALALVAIVGTVATFTLALQGRLNTLFAPFAFGVLSVWISTKLWRAWRERRHIAADLEAAYVLIIRVREENGDLSPAEEYLPLSRALWTVNGAPSRWRKVLRARTESA
ncbi:MAG: hypothetical protein ACXW2X_05690 [Thermoanaerobaculia bacterium]